MSSQRRESVNKGHTSEKLLGEYLVPWLPWKQISEARRRKRWEVPEREWEERLTDRQKHRQRDSTEAYGGWRMINVNTQCTARIRTLDLWYVYCCCVILTRAGAPAAWACEWAVTLHGPQAWLTPFHMNTPACVVAETEREREWEIIIFPFSSSPPQALRFAHRMLRCSGPRYTWVWHLVTDQLPAHLRDRFSQPEGVESSCSPPPLKLWSKLQVSCWISLAGIARLCSGLGI